MEHLFILGRNIELSIAEIFSYLKKEGIQIQFYSKKDNALFVETDKKIDSVKAINQLGGVLAIGKVLYSGNFSEILEKIKKNPIYFENKTRFSYSILNFSNEISIENLRSEIENKFRAEKLKASYKSAKGEIKMQEGNSLVGSPSNLNSIDVIYFLFKNEKDYFGIIEEVYNPKEIEKRDMKKPVRREAFAISPRLAKILINLSQIKEKENLLDPFCGIGVILQEALLQGINTIGIDINENAIGHAKKNINWLEKNYSIKANYKLINENSKTVKIFQVDGVATEPSLGMLLKKIPERRQAILMIKKFENLIVDVLNNIKKYVKKNGKIVFTAPLIKIIRGKISCNINEICRRTRLNLDTEEIDFPLREFRQDQIIGREIFVLVKEGD